MPLFWPDPSRSSRYLAKSVEIWPNHDKISPNLNEISPDLVGSGLDLDKISSDLVQSYGFQVNFCQITSNITEFCMFSSKNLRISPKVSGFMIRSGCSGFGRGKPPTNPKASGFMGNDLPPTVEVSVWAVFGSGSGGLVEYTGWVDSPSVLIEFNLFLFISSILEKTSKDKKLIVMSSVKYLISSFCSLELYIKNKFVD